MRPIRTVLLFSFALSGSFALAEGNSAEFTPTSRSCYADEVTQICQHGGERLLPGCSVACAQDQTAHCTQAKLDYSTCQTTPAECVCN